MTELRSKIADLSTEERVQLENRLLRARKKTAAKAAIPRRATFTPSPCSFTQSRLWFLDQYDPGSSVYNIRSVLRLEGVLDVSALAASLNALVARHETLRTRFGIEDGEPVQVIAPALKVPLPVDDLSGVPKEERESALQQQVQSETNAAFDLAQGPLLRARLLKLGEQSHVLALTQHHIISDGWSMGVLMRDLSALYAASCQGKPSPLAELPIQYADYAIWQRDWLQGEVLDKQLAYWREQLKDLPVLDLPTDRPRPALQSFRGARLQFDLPAAVTEGLEKVSHQAGVTLFMTLLAAFQLLLQRYSGQDDIVVGSPIAGRNRVELEGLIGFFANSLVLRTDLSGDPTFMELLGWVREVALGAYTHQDLPFDKLVEELQSERDLSRNPLFQIAFVLHNTPGVELDLPGIEATRQSMQGVTAKFDLTLSIVKTANRFGGVLEYNSDLFDSATVERLIVHYRTLLTGAMADPDQPVTGLSLLAESERRQLLFDWNATEAAYPKDQCIQQLFEAQVARTPAAVAVVYEDRQLSYAALNARANRLAHYLIEQGVGADTLVALCLERSLDLVVAVLGILKAGGAYVPLDPGYPKERLAFMLADTGAPVLITQTSLQAALPAHEATVLCLDEAVDPLAGYCEDNPAVRSQPHHLAYINYTSGSTGKPKGVTIPHQAVTRLVFGANYVSLDADKTLLHMAPISFDAATFELWGALLHGGRCVLYPERVPTPEGLQAIINQQGVDTLWLTAAFFNVVIDTDVEILNGVKQLLTGGEALSVSHIKKAQQQLKTTQLINGYGPTESTTFTCCYKIPKVLDEPMRSIPIGRPISNTQVYILDGQLKPVPIGVVGELYIGGDGLARGYLNRPELTAECFILNPLAGTPGARLYKSGDRARYLADGNIEFMGRSDDQVKIRGFRIELGEIEATLSQHPQVQDSLVLVREEEVGGKRLVAYVVSEPAAEDFAARLRVYLKETLPEYMVPSAFITLDAFPLTPNGKVDKAALCAMDLVQSVEAEYVAPRTPVEKELAAIWCELLQLDRVGVHDNFFELGGHSLLATKAISRMNTVWHSEFPLVMLFEHPTIAELATRIVQEQVDNTDEEVEGLLDELEDLSEEEQAAMVFGKQGDK